MMIKTGNEKSVVAWLRKYITITVFSKIQLIDKSLPCSVKVKKKIIHLHLVIFYKYKMN